MSNNFLSQLSTEPRSVRMRARRLRVKTAAMHAYGPEGRAECPKCGETDIEKLALECTSERMRQVKRDNKITGGAKLYSMLKAAGYPKGFRILCKSCQGIEANFGSRKNPFVLGDSEDEE